MKKLYTLLVALLIAGPLFSQNVLLYEDFEGDQFDYILNQWPSGSDNTYINADFDFMDDGSGGSRPGEWFLGLAFAEADGDNQVLMSNSWTNDATTPVANYFILPPIQLTGSNGMLYWKSAPRQTPRYLDGLQVLVSTSGNMPQNFTDTLMIYAEFVSGTAQPDDSSYANYTFTWGFVHGEDGQWIEYNGDSARFRGILRPDSASLAAYAGQTIYIAFCHGSTDDNLISIDELRVTGTGINLSNETSAALASSTLDVYPNPTADRFRVSYTLPHMGAVRLNVYDATGRLVHSIVNGTQLHGHYFFDVDTREWANGQYNVVLDAPHGKISSKLNVQN